MLTLTFAPDGATTWTGQIVLCNTTRSLTELAVEFNHERVLEPKQFYGQLTAAVVDQGNQRNTLSLRVRRSVDFTNTAFADPEAALAFALTQPAAFATTGCLRIQLVGVTSTSTLYLLNTGVKSIQMPHGDWLGIAPAFSYTFNGGLITTTAPF